MRLSRHAQTRSQQRALRPEILAVIHAFGTEAPAKGGCCRLLLDRRAIALASDGIAKRHAELEQFCGAYVVIGENDTLVTAGRQKSRFFN